MKKTKIFTILTSIFLLLPALIINAQTLNPSLDTGLNDSVGIGVITIPFFPVFDKINSKYATIFTWITFIADILIVLVIVFWIVRILLAGIEAIKSEGDQTKIQEAFAKLQSNLVGIGMTFLVPIVLTAIGFLLGIGSIFNWPKMFSGCEASSKHEYYFQAFLNPENGQDPTAYAMSECQLDSNT